MYLSVHDSIWIVLRIWFETLLWMMYSMWLLHFEIISLSVYFISFLCYYLLFLFYVLIRYEKSITHEREEF